MMRIANENPSKSFFRLTIVYTSLENCIKIIMCICKYIVTKHIVPWTLVYSVK